MLGLPRRTTREWIETCRWRLPSSRGRGLPRRTTREWIETSVLVRRARPVPVSRVARRGSGLKHTGRFAPCDSTTSPASHDAGMDFSGKARFPLESLHLWRQPKKQHGSTTWRQHAAAEMLNKRLPGRRKHTILVCGARNPRVTGTYIPKQRSLHASYCVQLTHLRSVSLVA